MITFAVKYSLSIKIGGGERPYPMIYQFIRMVIR
jgi:hypothetical protein